jgi:hypothetical protein
LPLLYFLFSFHKQVALVGVKGTKAIAVVENDEPAVAIVVPPGKFDDAIRCSDNGRALRQENINGAMTTMVIL